MSLRGGRRGRLRGGGITPGGGKSTKHRADGAPVGSLDPLCWCCHRSGGRVACPPRLFAVGYGCGSSSACQPLVGASYDAIFRAAFRPQTVPPPSMRTSISLCGDTRQPPVCWDWSIMVVPIDPGAPQLPGLFTDNRTGVFRSLFIKSLRLELGLQLPRQPVRLAVRDPGRTGDNSR